MKPKKIIIGTRGSQLSINQTNIVKNLLQPLVPDTLIEIITIKTSGDKNMSPIPLDTIGKGWFTKEIDQQLLDGKIDLAVHSLKDLLDTLTPGLIISAIPQKEDAREALVSYNDLPLKKLKKGAVIGTDSLRRKIQLLKIRPDLIVKSVRGNVNKRLEKFDAKEYDGLILAVAGLKRLGFEQRIAEYFDPSNFIPSPGQGALAIVTKTSNKKLNQILLQLNNQANLAAVTAEREFSKLVEGGCSMPVGAYAEIEKNKLTLHGMLGSEDGENLIKATMQGKIDKPKELAQKLAKKLLYQASTWYPSKQKYIVLTRSKEENEILAAKLGELGLKTLNSPSISISQNLSPQKFKKYLSNITDYDWIIFTSQNGVKFFMSELKTVGINLPKIKIAAVGEKTAESAKKYGLKISFIPKTFTSKGLAKDIPKLKGKKILLPRSNIGNPEFKEQLETKGAIVTDMPIYKTTNPKNKLMEFKNLHKNKQILYLTFTSPSTIEGFLKNINKSLLQTVLHLPVISIGPVTTKAAQKHGFKTIYTADTHTVSGMLNKLKKNIL